MAVGIEKAPKTAYPVEGRALVRVLNNTQLDQMKKAEEDAKSAEARQKRPAVINLASYVTNRFEANKTFREQSGVEAQMVKNLKQRNNQYDDQTIAAIAEEGGTSVFMGLTGLKCRAAEAWVFDTSASDREIGFTLKPSPLPELPPWLERNIVQQTLASIENFVSNGGKPVSPEAIFQYASQMRDAIEEEMRSEAEHRARLMERKVRDQLKAGGWSKAFSTFISNAITLKAGFMKGPILRKKRKLKWSVEKKKPVAGWVLTHEWESPSPFDMYPSKGATDTNEGDLVERLHLFRKDLLGMKGVPGYDDRAIDLVLRAYDQGGFRNWTAIDQERAQLEEMGSDTGLHQDQLEALEYWGGARGSMLIREGIRADIDGKAIKSEQEYELNAIVIGPHVIYSKLNPNPTGDRPYSKSGWATIPGSFWYKGVPELMDDLQRIANATIRALVNNESVCSGPQVVYNDINRIPADEDLESIYPFKVHQFTNSMQSQVKPMDFYQPAMNAGELIAVYQKFADMADDYTGVPSYEHGNGNVRGAGRTMGGLSMLMNSAARQIKMVIGRFDMEVTCRSIDRQVIWNMLFDEDESIKGDLETHSTGGLAQIIKENMAARRLEFLGITANPTDLKIMGYERRGNLLRESARALEMEPGDVVPDRDELKDSAEEWKAQDEAAAGGGQAASVYPAAA